MSDIGIDPRFARRNRQPGLDLLRALAIVVVVIYHAGLFGFELHEWHRFGWVGVDLFFVLSGYLIGGQLIAPLALERAFHLRRFFARRALRILPAYFFILAIYFALPSWREFPEISPLWKFILSVQNIDLRGGTAFSHAWSLAVEDQFYLLLPFTLLLVRRWPRAGLILPVLIVTGGLALRAYLAGQFVGPGGVVSSRAFQNLIYYPTWTRLDPLVFGVALAAVEKCRPVWWKFLTDNAAWLLLPGLTAIAYGLYLGESDLTIATCIWQFPLIAFGMAVLLLCAVSPRFPIHRSEVPGTAFLASIAYSVYLSHKLVIHAAIQLYSKYGVALKSALALFLVEVLIYLAGFLLFLAIERPCLKLRDRLTQLKRGRNHQGGVAIS